MWRVGQRRVKSPNVTTNLSLLYEYSRGPRTAALTNLPITKNTELRKTYPLAKRVFFKKDVFTDLERGRGKGGGERGRQTDTDVIEKH